MRVLSFGYGRHLFDSANTEHQRLNQCAGAVEALHHVVFTNKSERFAPLKTDTHFYLYPTNSRSKLFMIIDAFILGHRLIKQEGIDVITTQDPFETGLIGLCLKVAHPHVTLQVQEHGDVLASPAWTRERLSNRIRRVFAYIVLHRADIIRVVSKRTEQFLRKKFGTNNDIRVLSVSVPPSGILHVDRVRSRESRPFIFLTAARFVPQKNLTMMIRAFAHVHQTCPQARLRIFGGGALESELRALVITLKLSEVVDFQGWTDDLTGEMARADAYLLSSNYEGWGRVLVEAMLATLPIVTTDVGCVGEVVLDGVHALVTPVGDEAQFAHAMERMCTDVELYDTFVSHMQNIDTKNLPGAQMSSYSEQWARTLVR